MRAARNRFIIRVDHKEQEARKELIPGTGIVIAETYTDLKFFLQAAPIVDMGEEAKAFFPDAEIGDVLIFHHIIEHEDGQRLLDKNEEYSLLYVNATVEDVFGIQKIFDDHVQIIPHPGWVWCSKIENQALSTITPDGVIQINLYQYEDSIRAMIDEKQSEIQNWSESMVTPMIKEKIRMNQREMQQLNQELNKRRGKKTKIEFIHPTTTANTGLQQGDVAIFTGYIGYDGYPLSVQDMELTPDGKLQKVRTQKDYFLHRSDFLHAKQK